MTQEPPGKSPREPDPSDPAWVDHILDQLTSRPMPAGPEVAGSPPTEDSDADAVPEPPAHDAAHVEEPPAEEPSPPPQPPLHPAPPASRPAAPEEAPAAADPGLLDELLSPDPESPTAPPDDPGPPPDVPAARLDFQLSDETQAELRNALDARALSTISGDRIRHELHRIFDEAESLAALRLAEDPGVLSAIHPALSVRHISITPPSASPDPLVWVSALVWPLTASGAAAFAARVNAPADWSRAIADTTRLVSRMPQLDEPHLPPSRVCALLDGLAPGALAAAGMLGSRAAGEYIQRYLDAWWSVAPILRGTDLLELGVPAGPAVGELLRALRQARLDGITHTRQDEEDLVKNWSTTQT